ncbi:ATPase [Bacillus infantis]|uniref:Nuclease SbcCD subunit C n=1 Tax=Bacillus infantis TaxID=324767 RepID=A0A5D4SUE6_9BACI|nr:AAA family ATPase [Bacillus infantis]TYS66341.1 ATPase [Bacillus infantis]
MRIIKFVTLNLQNFKSHRDLTVKFGDLTKITGDNAKGKSSIPEAISWLLYGTTVFNSKLDPTPITYEAEETMVSLLLEVDTKQVLLGRGLKKGKTQYYINEAPKKAGDFTEILEQLFDKELFFSLFNPQYFFTLHWEKQRAMVLQYVTAPANKEVLKTMLDEQKKCLEPLLKKHSLEDLEGIHKENKKRMDKAYIAAQSRTKTLKEQLEQFAEQSAPLDSLKAELSRIDKEVRQKEAELDSAFEKNRDFDKVQARINLLQDQIDMSKEYWPTLKYEVIKDSCATCKRPFDEEARKAAEEDLEKRKQEYTKKHDQLRDERKVLQEQQSSLEYVDTTELKSEIKRLDDTGQPLRVAIQNYSQFNILQEQVSRARSAEKETLESLNDSIFVLDTIKAFKAKEAELQTEKVQALFETLSIRLFETQKNGEVKNTFIIEMDGKPHNMLSLSEGIRAGLELREVLSQQSEVIAPVFVDNAESITKFKQPSGQLILSRVVAGEDLKIKHD